MCIVLWIVLKLRSIILSKTKLKKDIHYRVLAMVEANPTSATNSYGRTKLHIEEMIASDLAQAKQHALLKHHGYSIKVGME